MKTSKKILGFVGFLLVSFSAAALGTIFTIPNVDGWYSNAAKPPWNPPDWLFAPVWTTLYFFIAIAAWLVWIQHKNPHRRTALIMFSIQIVLNALWTQIFFGGFPVFGNAALWIGFVVIAALDFFVILMLFAYKKINIWAMVLMVPYLMWVLYASSLNLALAVLN